MTDLYPIFIDLENRLCVVVGGGNIALRKAKSLADAGAKLRIVAPVICGELKSSLGPNAEIREREYTKEDIDSAVIVVAATDDASLNSKIASDCRDAGILVNAVDQPSDCDFHVPGVVKCGSIQIAVSTGGESPAMAGWLRREIEKWLGPKYDEALKIVAEARRRSIEDDPEGFEHRAKRFREFFQTDIWRGFLDGKNDLSVEEVVLWISSSSD